MNKKYTKGRECYLSGHYTMRIIHEQVFIHECKSLLLRDPSDYKIFLCGYTLTHAIDTHYILQDNDVSYVRENEQDLLGVSV